MSLLLIFALIQVIESAPSREPLFSLGNVITIIVVILTGAAVVLRAEGKLKALVDIVEEHIKDDQRQLAVLVAHTMDDDKHIGRRLYDELMRRFDRANEDRERMEQKIDALLMKRKVD